MDELSARGEAETENIGDDEEEMVEVKKEKERSEAERTEAAEQRRAERAVDQEGEHIILAISYNGGHFGAAVYDQLTATIQLLRDCSESSDFRLIESLIVQTRPTVILACRSQDLNLLRWLARNFSDESVDLNGTYAMGEDSTLPSERTNEFITTGETGRGEGDDHNAGQPDADEIGEESGERLDPAAFNRSCSLRANDENGEEGMEVEREEHGQNGEDDEADDIDDDQQWSKPKLVTIVSSSYKYEKAVQRIKELFESEESSDKLQTLTRFRIDLESRNMVRAFGALLRYMDATRIGVQNEPLTVRSPVRVVKTLVLEELMEIDRNTFLALDIFAPTRRQEAGYRSILAGELKKNATLFGLVNRCKSTPGRAMLRHWFEHPILNREILRKRQRAVSFFTHDCYADITSNIFSRTILKRFRAGTSTVQHWKNLYDTLYFLITVGRILHENNVKLELLEDIGKVFTEDLAEVAVILGTVIDFSESRIENRIVTNEGVDPELDKTKQLYANLPGILTGIAMEEAKRLQTPSCSIGYIPLIGYLTALPLDYPIESMPELEVIYETKDSVQVKSKKMTELDEQLGDVKLQIIDKETTIMLRMQKKVLSIAGLIRGAMRAAATLDAVISLAISAREFGWRCPELVDSSIIEAKNAEHPLARLIVKKIKKSFVGNPISSGGDFSKAKIFTGPNSCGKTVYMKMVGVITFLAHIGSFVPAEGARIGRIDKIMTRLYTVDYVLEGMSTFAIDLNQVAMAIRRASGNSLVIIDEFGKGTMTEVGLSLLSSALSYWIEKGKSRCPHLLSSTHFHAIASHIPVDHSIASFHTFETRQVGDRMRFLYKLIDGVVDCSFAVHTAKEAGIEDSIIDRCTQVYTALKEGKSLTEIKLEESEQERNTNEILLHGMNEIIEEFLQMELENQEDEEKLMKIIEKNLHIEEIED